MLGLFSPDFLLETFCFHVLQRLLFFFTSLISGNDDACVPSGCDTQPPLQSASQAAEVCHGKAWSLLRLSTMTQ